MTNHFLCSTGSGKTTQIPQYIMETACERNAPCRILCTQPRRISAIASAERVCYESGVSMGSSVGYQIRLDSKISAGSHCIFLTPGVFLRYMMGRTPEKLFHNITHIIIDEAHERNKENDFLLTSIKEHFHVNPNLKLIIMSATMDTTIFKNYFGTSEEISISIKQYHVEEYYLEDVLKMVNFTNAKVNELNKRYRSGQLIQASKSAYINEEVGASTAQNDFEYDEEFKNYLDELLENMSTHENPESFFDEFLYYVTSDGTPIDYRHRQTKMTALMIAIGREWHDMADKLLQLKANPNLKVDFGGYEMNAFEIADKLHGSESKMKELLLNFTAPKKNLSNDDFYNKALLNIYQDTVLKTKSNNFVVEESIDHELIVQLVQKLHNETDRKSAILIFLPGFDDIIQLSKLIDDTIKYDYSMFLLHSSMRTDDQKNVFRASPQGKRKIILSTNIAESSITIDDVVYVIDSGREKQKSYDAISHSSSLRVQWISKASANQRRGRAGRLR
jgi:HrpA-like RNA helicase